MEEHVAEFDHRYAILAEEIANLKNITLNLQNYTMEVNKVLMEEHLSKKQVEKVDAKEEYEVPNIEFQFEPEQEEEEPAVEELVVEEPVSKESVAEEPVTEEPVSKESVAEESVSKESVVEEPVVEEPAAEADPFSVNIVSKKDKKGNKKSTAEKSEEQLTL
jgi:hypothetical protein